MNTQDVLDLGKVGLFYGIETVDWTAAGWQSAANFCKTHGVNFAIVKVFDAGNEWYGGNFAPIVSIFKAAGVKVLPYGFMGTADGLDYNLDRDLPNELPLVKKYMQEFGLCCGDMEGSGWFNRPDLGSMVTSALMNAPGTFVASMPANPVDAGQITSFEAMKTVVAAWMPMAYNDYLSSVYKSQLSRLGGIVAPTFDLSSEFGANDVVRNVQAANERQVSFWYDGFAASNTTLFDQCVKAVPQDPPPVPKPVDPHMITQFNDVWASSQFVPKGYESGIYRATLEGFLSGAFNSCFPTQAEVKTVDFNGNAIQYQALSNGLHAEYDGHGVTRFYDYTGKTVFQK